MAKNITFVDEPKNQLLENVKIKSRTAVDSMINCTFQSSGRSIQYGLRCYEIKLSCNIFNDFNNLNETFLKTFNTESFRVDGETSQQYLTINNSVSWRIETQGTLEMI